MRQALLIIDMQTDLLAADGRFPVAQAQVPGLIDKSNEAIRGAEERGVPVAYIVNAFRRWDPGNLFRGRCCLRGRPGSELDPRVHLVARAPNFEKWRGSAFCNDRLAKWLVERGLNALVVAGVYADACVRATVADALKRGLHVTVLSDAVAAGGQAGREKGLRKMEDAGAEVTSVAAWLDGDNQGAET